MNTVNDWKVGDKFVWRNDPRIYTIVAFNDQVPGAARISDPNGLLFNYLVLPNPNIRRVARKKKRKII